jgi:hypothetical protein
LFRLSQALCAIFVSVKARDPTQAHFERRIPVV